MNAFVLVHDVGQIPAPQVEERKMTRLIELMAATAASVAVQVSATASSPAIPDWLAGAWVAQQPDGSWTEEWWTSARGGIMLGAGRSGKGDKLDWWEQTRIERIGDKVTFCALPKGQKGACFAATKLSASEVVFENAGHDFPTRVAYRREGDQLLAEASGPGGADRQRWTFRRAD